MWNEFEANVKRIWNELKASKQIEPNLENVLSGANRSEFFCNFAALKWILLHWSEFYWSETCR